MAEAVIQPAETGREAAKEQSVAVPREFGFWAVLIFAVSSIGLAYSGLLPFSQAVGIWPGSDAAGTITVAVILALLHAYTYALIGVLAPRYGADYLVASRVLHPGLAFASSWTLVIFMAVASGFYASSIAQSTIPMFIQILSLVTGDKGLLDLITTFNQPAGVVMVGTVVVVLIYLMTMVPSRYNRRALTIWLGLILIAFGVIFYQLLSAPQNAFPQAWDRLMGQGSYLNQLMEARKLGMQVRFTPQASIMAGLVMGFWMFFGYFNSTLFAGEVKNPKRNLLFGSWAALLFSWALLASLAFLVQRLVPLEWLSAESFLGRTAGSTVQGMPWLPLYAAILLPSPVLVWLVGIAWVHSMLALAHTSLYAAGRVLVAWSEDQVMPDAVSSLHPVLRSPLIGVLLVSILAIVGVVGNALSGGIDTSVNPVFILACAQILPVLALMLLPFLKKDWYERAPRLVRLKVGPLPLVTLAGGFSLLYLLWTIVATLIFPGFGALNGVTLLLFLIIFMSGLAWFYGRRAYLKAQGQNIDENFKRLPEDQ